MFHVLSNFAQAFHDVDNAILLLFVHPKPDLNFGVPWHDELTSSCMEASRKNSSSSKEFKGFQILPTSHYPGAVLWWVWSWNQQLLRKWHGKGKHAPRLGAVKE